MERLRPYYGIFLLLYFLLLAGRQLGSSELIYFGGDESRHFMNGVFYHDLIADGGWRAPLDYVRWYYLKYPALSVHQYPPLFYLLEALIVAVAGVRPLAVQVVILAMLTGGLFVWQRMLIRRFSPETAFFAVLWLLSTRLWLRNFTHIMLDSTAVAVALVVFAKLWRWEVTERRRDLALAFLGLALVLGIDFKPYFLVFYAGLFMLYHQVRTRSRRARLMMLALGFFGVFLLFFTVGSLAQITRIPLLYRTLQGANMISVKNVGKLFTGNFRFLVKLHVLQVFTLAGVVVPLCGLGLAIKSGAWRALRAELLYAATFVFVFSVCILHFEPARFHLFLLPVMALLSGLACERARNGLRGVSRHVAGGLMVGAVVWQGLAFTPASFTGYEQAAREVVALNSAAAPILCDAYNDGNFIAFVRKYDPDKRQIVFRGDKLLFTSVIYYKYVQDVNVKHADDVYRLLDEFGIRYILVDGLYTEMAPKALLRQVLRDAERFTRLADYSVDTNIQAYASAGLTLYEYRQHLTNETTPLAIDIPVMSTEFSFTLQELQEPFRVR